MHCYCAALGASLTYLNYSQLIAAATLYLAGKVKDEPLKIRDLVHVVHCTLNRNAELPDKEDDFWLIRDSIVQAELLITRMLKFDFNVIHPHKVIHEDYWFDLRLTLLLFQYMLHFMKVLQDWFGSSVWNSMPIAKTAAGFVQDFHQSPAILLYKPSHIAICCLSLAFQIYGVQVPVRSDQEVDADLWYTVFVGEDLIKDKHWEICEAILAIYDEHKDGLTRHSFSTGQISA